MKHNMIHRILNERINGGITTYAFLMFGLAIILYMFNFTNMFMAYQDSAKVENNSTNITNPSFQHESNPLLMLLNSVISFALKNSLLVIGGIGGLVFMGALGYFIGGVNFSVFYAQIIIIGLLAVVLNFFVFPLTSLDSDLANMELAPGLGVSVAIIVFFNLFFILSIIDFVRGTPS